jgi:predicted ATPase
MEQPEIHLHPRVQAELADAFISAVQSYEDGQPRDVQLVIESHSEHFLLRLQRRVAEGLLKPEEVAIYFVRDGKTGAQLEELKLDIFGEIENWPEGFFGDDLGEITARTKAAMQRRIQGEGQTHG